MAVLFCCMIFCMTGCGSSEKSDSGAKEEKTVKKQEQQNEKEEEKDLFFSGEKEIKKLPMEFNPIGSFLCLFIERMTFGLEWQIVFGIARSKFRHSRRSWRRNGRTGSHWSTCTNTLYFPCADTIEPAIIPLTGVNVE